MLVYLQMCLNATDHSPHVTACRRTHRGQIVIGPQRIEMVERMMIMTDLSTLRAVDMNRVITRGLSMYRRVLEPGDVVIWPFMWQIILNAEGMRHVVWAGFMTMKAIFCAMEM